MWQCLSHGCCIWQAGTGGGVYGPFGLSCSKAYMAQLARVLLM